MINLFHINQYKIDTSKLGNWLHGDIVSEFEQRFADYVGAKYACSANSASSLIYLALKEAPWFIHIPSCIPPVVPNAIKMAQNPIVFLDDIDWVGNAYTLVKNNTHHIVDSAQEVTRNQFKDLGNPDAQMIFSFYPTKPVGSCDGGMVVSDNKDSIDSYRTNTLNGMEFSENNWERKHVKSGHKKHWNSISAYIANKNLSKIDSKQERLDEIRDVYNKAFDYNNISRHLYRIRVENNKEFIGQMKVQGIVCGIHYEHCHQKKFYVKQLAGHPSLSKSKLESEQTVSLPFHEKLTNKDIKKVIKYANENWGVS